MRIGPIHNGSSVHWETQDGSAKAGKKYVKVSGILEFAPAAQFEELRIEIVQNEDWDPTLEFIVALKEEGLKNAIIQASLMTCRVKIMDDDVFPHNRFQDIILQDRFEDIKAHSLLVEYIKMNFKNTVIRRGTLKICAVTALESLTFLVELVLQVFLINEVLVPSIARKKYDSSGYAKLVVVVLMMFFPRHLLHYLSRSLGINEVSSQLLQSSLLRKYMTYTADSRKQVGLGEMVLLLSDSIPEVADKAYGSIFPLIQSATQLCFILIYQAVVPFMFGGDLDIVVGLSMTCVFFMFPIVMLISLVIRHKKSNVLMEKARNAKVESSHCTIDILANFYLLSDYSRCGGAIDTFESTINTYNGALISYLTDFADNKFVPVSLSLLLSSAWIFGGGLLLASESSGLDLGTFLTNLAIINQIGTCWGTIYQSILSMREINIELGRITQLLNLPTDGLAQRRFVTACDKATRSRIRTIKEVGGLRIGENAVDRLPIWLHELPLSKACGRVGERSKTITMELEQGRLHAIAGRHKSGKTTLLRLIAGRTQMNPDSPIESLYVPQHLRILHVSKEPFFFAGSLYKNLCFGVVHEADADARLERVLAICKDLGVGTQTLGLISASASQDAQGQTTPWNEVLPYSERRLLNIARGLISNPEILCLHMPAVGLNHQALPTMYNVLKLFVQQRGLKQDFDQHFFRRPRTCIITVASPEEWKFADQVHRPFANA